MTPNDCPAREKALWRWWIFSGEQYQPHEFKYLVSWDMWWTVIRTCEHCDMQFTDFHLEDYQLMKYFDLTKCPPKNDGYDEMSLREYKCPN